MSSILILAAKEKAMQCPTCELRMKVDRLREENEATTIKQAQQGDTRCFINMVEDKTTISIYGTIGKESLERLLSLLIEIDKERMAPSSTG